MLHILWLIFKFILIAVGVILGLILLILLTILFCPFRYELAASKETDIWKDTSAKAAVSWLFTLIRVKIYYQNGKLDKEIYLFGIPLLKTLAKIKKCKKKKKIVSKTQKVQESSLNEEIPRIEDQTKAENKKDEEMSVIIEEVPVIEETVVSESVSVKEESAAPEEGTVNEDSTETKEITESANFTEPNSEEQKKNKIKKNSSKKKTTKTEKQKEESEPADKKIKEKVSFKEKIRKIFEKIHSAIQNIEKTKNKIAKQIDWWRSFLGHPKFKVALKLLTKRVIRLLKHILPTKMKGHVIFGSDDPAITGKVLAIMGMTIPFHKNAITIEPLFDGTKKIEGNVELKGRIYIIVFVVTGMELFFNKNIRFVIKKWKHRKQKEG